MYSLPYYPTIMQKEDAAPFATLLVDWFTLAQRDLPWRKKYTPYEVWISEVMLQQTQMERGVGYFLRWMNEFPSVFDVAKASLDTVHKAWEGLGYYARAKNLHACAQEIVTRFGGEFPKERDVLVSLPGIGPYTAGAICSIAHNQDVPLVDANVERVFSRLFDVDALAKSKEAQSFFWKTAEACIPSGKARIFNQALMELGALICKKRPNCLDCPVKNYCRAYHLHLETERPLTGKKVAYTHLHIVTAVLWHNRRVFIQKRLDHGAWGGLWEFPGGRIEADETPDAAAVREFFEETELSVRVAKKLGIVQHAYTRYKITLHCFLCTLSGIHRKKSEESFPTGALHAASENRWADEAELATIAFPAGHRKLLDLWGEQVFKKKS